MVFRLKRGEDIGKSVRRMLVDEVDAALGDLAAEPDKIHEGIHEARKRFKKIRGVLRFVRSALYEQQYQQENALFRDLARSLSALRDAEALLEAIARLAAHAEEPKTRAALHRAKKLLQRERESLAALSLESQLANVKSTLRKARTRLRKLALPSRSFEDISGDVRRVYRRGHRALALAYERGEDVPMHELRKASKYLWHHVRILAPFWPALMDPYAHALKELGDLLGEHHDLAVLDELLRDRRVSLPKVETRLIRAQIKTRKAELHRQARVLATRIYAETPRRFAERLTAYARAFEQQSGQSAR